MIKDLHNKPKLQFFISVAIGLLVALSIYVFDKTNHFNGFISTVFLVFMPFAVSIVLTMFSENIKLSKKGAFFGSWLLLLVFVIGQTRVIISYYNAGSLTEAGLAFIGYPVAGTVLTIIGYLTGGIIGRLSVGQRKQ